jgi:ribonuclease HI
MAYGYAFYKPDETTPFYANQCAISDNHESTNFRAYYYSVVKALEELLAMDYADKVIEVRTDMRGVVNKIVDWIIYPDWSPMQQDLLVRIDELHDQFKKVRFVWIDKKENAYASQLANIGLTLFTGSNQ